MATQNTLEMWYGCLDKADDYHILKMMLVNNGFMNELRNFHLISTADELVNMHITSLFIKGLYG
jgi:hypothetical protein